MLVLEEECWNCSGLFNIGENHSKTFQNLPLSISHSSKTFFSAPPSAFFPNLAAHGLVWKLKGNMGKPFKFNGSYFFFPISPFWVSPPIFSRWRNFGPLTSGPSTFCFFVADSSTCSGSDSEKWSISAGKTKTPSADLQLEAKILSFHFSRCWCLMSNRWEGASAASQPGDWSEWHGDEAPVIPT